MSAIQAHAHGAPASFHDTGCGGLGPFFLDIANDDGRAFFRQPRRRGGADPASAAGNGTGFPRQTSHSALLTGQRLPA